jgi:hypothetical protein
VDSPAIQGNYKYDSLRAMLPPQQQDPSAEDLKGRVSSTGKEIKPILSSEKVSNLHDFFVKVAEKNRVTTGIC